MLQALLARRLPVRGVQILVADDGSKMKKARFLRSRGETGRVEREEVQQVYMRNTRQVSRPRLQDGVCC